MDTIGSRILNALAAQGLKQSDLVQLTGIGKSSISTYISGAYEPKRRNIYKIAKALDVNESWLMGHDVPMRDEPGQTPTYDNILPITTKRIPILGEIAAGVPIMAKQDYESYVECGAEVHADFALRVKGDSMMNARIYDGDVVFIREQPVVDQGEIAAVIHDGEATLKRFYQKGEIVTLLAENPDYAPIVIQLGIDTDVRILGKAIAAQFDIK